MYRFGEDFNYDSSIEDLFLDYLEKIQKKNTTPEINVYINYEYYDNSNKEKKDAFVCEEARKDWLPWKFKNEYGNQAELENEQVEKIISPITAEIYPYTKEIIEKVSFEKNSVYENRMEKKIIQQMVEEVYQKICTDDLEKGNNIYTTENLLKALIEFMIIKEICDKKMIKED